MVTRNDKETIHQDYIRSDLSLRAFAKKHHLSLSTLHSWKTEGLWDAEKKSFLTKSAEIARKRADIKLEQQLNGIVDRMEMVLEASDKLLVKVGQLLDLEDALAPRDLKSISSVLVDVQMLHSNAEKKDDGGEGNTWTINIGGVEDA